MRRGPAEAIPCDPIAYLSSMCERGTKGCNVRHGERENASAPPLADRLAALLQRAIPLAAYAQDIPRREAAAQAWHAEANAAVCEWLASASDPDDFWERQCDVREKLGYDRGRHEATAELARDALAQRSSNASTTRGFQIEDVDRKWASDLYSRIDSSALADGQRFMAEAARMFAAARTEPCPVDAINAATSLNKSDAYPEALLRVAVVARDVRKALVPAVSEPKWPHHRLADSFVRRLCDALSALDASPASAPCAGLPVEVGPPLTFDGHGNFDEPRTSEAPSGCRCVCTVCYQGKHEECAYGCLLERRKAIPVRDPGEMQPLPVDAIRIRRDLEALELACERAGYRSPANRFYEARLRVSEGQGELASIVYPHDPQRRESASADATVDEMKAALDGADAAWKALEDHRRTFAAADGQPFPRAVPKASVTWHTEEVPGGYQAFSRGPTIGTRTTGPIRETLDEAIRDRELFEQIERERSAPSSSVDLDLELEVRRLRESLAWTIAVIDHELPPFPDATGDDGEAMSQAHFASNMREARKLAAKAVGHTKSAAGAKGIK